MKRESAHPSTKFLVWFDVVCVSLCIFYEHVSWCWYFVLLGHGEERRREEVLRKMFWVWVRRCQIFLLRALIRNLFVFGIQIFIFIFIPILLTIILILVRTYSRHFQPIFPHRSLHPTDHIISILSRFLSSTLSSNPRSLAPFSFVSHPHALVSTLCSMSERMNLGHLSLSPGHWKPCSVSTILRSHGLT